MLPVTSSVVNLPAAGVVVPIAGGVSIEVTNGVLISAAAIVLNAGTKGPPVLGPLKNVLFDSGGNISPLVTSNVVNLPAAGVVAPIAGGVNKAKVMSAASILLNVGPAAAPDIGPAKILLAT